MVNQSHSMNAHPLIRFSAKQVARNPRWLLMLLLWLPVSMLHAENGPSSNIAWDAAQVNFVKSGDPARGKKLNQELTCAMCHGEQGVSEGRNWPDLAGQNPNYLFKQLLDYHDHKRADTEAAKVMVELAGQLTQQDMADLAMYYAQFPLPPGEDPAFVDETAEQAAQKLVQFGDGQRMIPPCFACHGTHGEGNTVDMPALAGQQAVYFRNTMRDFKNGRRHNDIYGRMRYMSKALTLEEIDALAQYYAKMRPPE